MVIVNGKSIKFKNKFYMYTAKRYKREIKNLLNEALRDLNCEEYHYISKSSESIYVTVRPVNTSKYIMFTIKGHTLFDPRTNNKVLYTTEYENRDELVKDIRSFIVGSLNGRYSSLSFKYKHYLGLNTMSILRSKGYRVIFTGKDYHKDLNGKVKLIRGLNVSAIKDEVFLNRLSKLINIDLVKGYDLENGEFLLHLTGIGVKLHKLERVNFESRYITDMENKALEGVVEKDLK